MDRTRMRLVAALVVGVLSVPAVAYVAGARNSTAEDPAAAPTTTEVVAAVPATDATASDLYLACGVEGEALVAGEAAETLTPVEQAALDALRTICADAGLPLPGPTPAEPRVVVIEASAGPAAAPATVEAAYDDGHEDHEGVHDDDDDEHEDWGDGDHGEDD